MRRFFKAILAGAVALGLASPVMAQDKVIKMGTLSWEDLTPITGITKKVLEDKGFTVELTEFSEWGIAYAALTKGDIQIIASQTDYVAQDYWNRNKNRLEKISPVSHGLYQAIAVPKYVPIDSIEELNDNADKFGGRIIGIEPGSGLMREAADAVDAYGLKLQLIEGSTAGMTAALKSATDRQEWIAVTLWEPTWMALKFDTKFLADPKGIFAPPQGYYWIGQKGFAEANPEAREVIASVYVPIADIARINAAVNDGKTMDQAVAEWTAAHEDLLKRWENIKSY
ncbi:glycine betaine ABC transporter substrate-binding protein [Paracoccus versutus]|uniref:Glycine betaine/proline transport system substrate-binding protein n=1 Tax=Paracoccus versutus TaxID=34007 RepID=A0AAQ0HIV5_PARVE|nr:glycine betaine ABC transporter substrate-binding protein [Paracoccus versutus]KGJ06008.1 glycine/betaine ABC transporter [Paracoccus versutus]REG54038.1 glycine betaine/proline transport system substrate-binding protein [Paracoccus versutus]WEJ79228.1 glycine betaine ABC transporter substrate-binding protein [Paracoccus versutus]